ncbi:hemagglutinin [Mycoplasmopsis synoviae]|uniref:hemagglutinin n=1 Tax=Mycoplasmopsis synoviae TaxID=2109 RepID=UPI0034DB5F4D
MLNLYWDGFMPKIVVDDGYVEDTEENNKENNKNTNQQKLEAWFAANQDKFTLVADQLTRKLGEEKFKNMTLSNPTISWDESVWKTKTILTPKVTFNLTPKEGYEKATGSLETVTLTIRNLYKEANPDTNVFATQGALSSATPNNASQANDATTIEKVNVYLNYTGPSIVLDEALPTVGATPNTSINGTSNVTGDFNTKFKKLLVSGTTQTPLLQTIINYVNKFDPKFPASFVLKTNGVAIASVQNNTQLKIGSLNDFLWNNKGFLQQVNTDTKAVYFAVIGVASNGWLNTFLIRIPLTKFVRSITPFTAPAVMTPTTEDSQEESRENSSQADNTEQNAENQADGQSGGEATETQEAQGDSASQSSPQT